MKVFHSIFLLVFVLESIQSENLAFETEKENANSSFTVDCHLNGSCVRLCSNESSDASPDFKSIKGAEKLKKGFFIEYGRPCEFMLKETELWELVANGTIVTHSNYNDKLELLLYPQSQYCLQLNGTDDPWLQICIDYVPMSNEIRVVKMLYPYFMFVSIPFLVATIFIYAGIEELRNLHGKCLMSYCFGLVLLYSSLGFMQLNNHKIFGSWACKLTGYVAYISILICFLWLNVMCHDVWSTFRKNYHIKRSSNKRFLFYCFYAFGVPALIFLAVFLGDESSFLPNEYKIGMGKDRCFTKKDRLATTIYLYLPISFILLLNTFYYSVTTYKIFQVQKEFSVNQNNDSSRHSKISLDKTRFFLYLRLFVMMGVIWFIELISFTVEHSFILHLFTILNCAQGVVIFILFICKPQVKQLIVKRLSSKKGVSPFKQQVVLSHTESTHFSHAFTTQSSTTREKKTTKLQMQERVQKESPIENSKDDMI